MAHPANSVRRSGARPSRVLYPHEVMYAVGIVEVAAGVLVAVHARLGALVIAAWLTGILISLVLIPASTTWRCETSAFTGCRRAAAPGQPLRPRPLGWPLRRG